MVFVYYVWCDISSLCFVWYLFVSFVFSVVLVYSVRCGVYLFCLVWCLFVMFGVVFFYYVWCGVCL